VIRLLIAARYAAISVALIALVLLLAFGQRVSYEQSINSFFAENDPLMAAYDKASALFGDDNFVFLVYDDPELFTPLGMDRVGELARDVGPDKVEGVLRVESLDAMPLLWLVDDVLVTLDRLPQLMRNAAVRTMRNNLKKLDPKTNALMVAGAVRSGDAAAREALRKRLTAHPLFLGTLLDASGMTTAVVVRLTKTGEHDVTKTVAALRRACDAFAFRHHLKKRPAVVGPPVLLGDGFAAIERDGRRLAVVGMMLIGVVTLSAVRSLWWALVPLLAGWIVWLATEEILVLCHLNLSFSGGPLVAQIIVLTMPAASHLAIHFRDHRRREADAVASARSTLGAVWAPIFWCAITGAIGYGALVTSDVVPIRQFGAILGSCTLVAALLVMAISPVAMLPPFRLEVPVRHGSESLIGTAMNRLTAWVVRHPGPIVAGVLLVVLPVASGMFSLTYESNYINLFRQKTRVVRDYHTVETKLGGIGLVEVVAPVGKAVDHRALARIAELDQTIRGKDEGTSGVSFVISLATVLDPDGRLSKLPPASLDRVLATKLELIAASPQAELLNGFWSPKTGQTRLLVRLLEQQPASRKAAIFDRAVRDARASFGPDAWLTGLSYLMTKTTEAIIVTQWNTFLWSVIGILLMLTIALRGPVLAALALLPTLLAVGLVLGLMGWLGVKLDMATALVASVALGLSVDDTFHCLLQFHRERAGQPFEKSLFDSYAVTGPGVLLSSIAVAVGFAALWLSEFVPFANFGTMVGIATAGSTLGNLILLPACLALGERIRARLRERRKPAAVEA
jgi:predicted RND superfamily exporter protein